MSKAQAIGDTLGDCHRILDRTAEMIEDFIHGKMPEKYGTTILAKDLSAETGLSLSLVMPLVSKYIERDDRVESNKGRYNGGLRLTEVGKAWLAAAGAADKAA
jgi:hypothetical protein